jgi:hypothetical protein
MTEPATALCRHCAKRFNRRRYTNRYQRAGGNLIASMAYCSPACRQAAYRVRRDIEAGIPASSRRHRIGKRRLRPLSTSVTEAIKLGPATDLASSVTQPEIPSRIQRAARVEKTPLPQSRLIEIEVFAPHCWEHRFSSGGLPIQVAQLRPSVLLRR